MKVHQYIHELNNTEIGNTNTNETYVSVPRALAPKIQFLIEGEMTAIYKRSGLPYTLKFQPYNNGEYRITKLGPLYRETQVQAGDLILIEDCAGQIYIDFILRKNLIVFACKKKSTFECLNEDRVLPILDKDLVCAYEGTYHELKIIRGEAYQPRSDSSRTIYAYRLMIDESEILSKKDVLFNIFCIGGKAVMSEVRRDQIYKTEWSDYE